jgi:hypothetical protein
VCFGGLAVIRKTSTFVQPTRTITLIKQDDPDNRLLECAHAARADYLVTGNTKPFPKSFEATAIVTPKQFIDLLLPHFAQLRHKKSREKLFPVLLRILRSPSAALPAAAECS